MVIVSLLGNMNIKVDSIIYVQFLKNHLIKGINIGITNRSILSFLQLQDLFSLQLILDQLEPLILYFNATLPVFFARMTLISLLSEIITAIRITLVKKFKQRCGRRFTKYDPFTSFSILASKFRCKDSHYLLSFM